MEAGCVSNMLPSLRYTTTLSYSPIDNIFQETVDNAEVGKTFFRICVRRQVSATHLFSESMSHAKWQVTLTWGGWMAVSIGHTLRETIGGRLCELHVYISRGCGWCLRGCRTFFGIAFLSRRTLGEDVRVWSDEWRRISVTVRNAVSPQPVKTPGACILWNRYHARDTGNLYILHSSAGKRRGDDP